MLLCLSICSLAANGQTEVITYTLDEVRFSGAQLMTGTFEWTYEQGDFENGSGVFTDIHIPWYWSGLSELAITVDLTSIEFTFDGNLHDRGLDITLFLEEALSPTHSVAIDLARSRYQVEVGITHEGPFLSGSVAPFFECLPDLNGDGSLNFFDISTFLTAFVSFDPIADFTGDGQFNFFDVSVFLQEFSSGCG